MPMRWVTLTTNACASAMSDVGHPVRSPAQRGDLAAGIEIRRRRMGRIRHVGGVCSWWVSQAHQNVEVLDAT